MRQCEHFHPQEGETYCELFMDLLVKINKEETLQYLLTLVDQLLKGNHDQHITGVQLFQQHTES